MKYSLLLSLIIIILIIFTCIVQHVNWTVFILIIMNVYGSHALYFLVKFRSSFLGFQSAVFSEEVFFSAMLWNNLIYVRALSSSVSLNTSFYWDIVAKICYKIHSLELHTFVNCWVGVIIKPLYSGRAASILNWWTICSTHSLDSQLIVACLFM